MRTLGVAWCGVLAAAIAPCLLPGGDAYLRLIWEHRAAALATVVLWVLVFNWLLRQALVVALRVPGSRIRAGTRPGAQDDAA